MLSAATAHHRAIGQQHILSWAADHCHVFVGENVYTVSIHIYTVCDTIFLSGKHISIQPPVNMAMEDLKSSMLKYLYPPDCCDVIIYMFGAMIQYQRVDIGDPFHAAKTKFP